MASQNIDGIAWPGVFEWLDHESTSHPSERWWNCALALFRMGPRGLRLAGNDVGAYRLWLNNSQMILLLDNFGISTQIEIRSWFFGFNRGRNTAKLKLRVPQLRSVAWERSGSWMVGLCLSNYGEHLSSAIHIQEDPLIKVFWCFTRRPECFSLVWIQNHWTSQEFEDLHNHKVNQRKSSDFCVTAATAPGWRMRGWSSRKLPAKRWCTSHVPWSGPRWAELIPSEMLRFIEWEWESRINFFFFYHLFGSSYGLLFCQWDAPSQSPYFFNAFPCTPKTWFLSHWNPMVSWMGLVSWAPKFHGDFLAIWVRFFHHNQTHCSTFHWITTPHLFCFFLATPKGQWIGNPCSQFGSYPLCIGDDLC